MPSAAPVNPAPLTSVDPPLRPLSFASMRPAAFTTRSPMEPYRAIAAQNSGAGTTESRRREAMIIFTEGRRGRGALRDRAQHDDGRVLDIPHAESGRFLWMHD